MAASEWSDELEAIATQAGKQRTTKAELAESIRSVARKINSMT